MRRHHEDAVVVVRRGAVAGTPEPRLRRIKIARSAVSEREIVSWNNGIWSDIDGTLTGLDRVRFTGQDLRITQVIKCVPRARVYGECAPVPTLGLVEFPERLK